MEKTTIYLSSELRRALADYARTTRRPQSEIIREAIASFISAASPPKVSFIGSGADSAVSGASSETYLRTRFGKS